MGLTFRLARRGSQRGLAGGRPRGSCTSWGCPALSECSASLRGSPGLSLGREERRQVDGNGACTRSLLSSRRRWLSSVAARGTGSSPGLGSSQGPCVFLSMPAGKEMSIRISTQSPALSVIGKANPKPPLTFGPSRLETQAAQPLAQLLVCPQVAAQLLFQQLDPPLVLQLAAGQPLVHVLCEGKPRPLPALKHASGVAAACRELGGYRGSAGAAAARSARAPSAAASAAGPSPDAAAPRPPPASAPAAAAPPAASPAPRRRCAAGAAPPAASPPAAGTAQLPPRPAVPPPVSSTRKTRGWSAPTAPPGAPTLSKYLQSRARVSEEER